MGFGPAEFGCIFRCCAAVFFYFAIVVLFQGLLLFGALKLIKEDNGGYWKAVLTALIAIFLAFVVMTLFRVAYYGPENTVPFKGYEGQPEYRPIDFPEIDCGSTVLSWLVFNIGYFFALWGLTKILYDLDWFAGFKGAVIVVIINVLLAFLFLGSQIIYGLRLAF